MVDSLIAHLKLVIIIKAVNQIANNDNEWIPDENNSKQRQ